MTAEHDNDKSIAVPATARRLPAWLKRRIPASARIAEVAGLLSELSLATVCDGANCPNRAECYAAGTATFMILGRHCTRNCRFCAVKQGEVAPPSPDECEAVAEAAGRLSLRHVVITSVTRDDLPDGGAEQFARTILAVRRRLPAATIEVLTPDFQGSHPAVDTVLAAGPDVFNHNVETVPRLYPAVRPQADYRQSLDLLAHAHSLAVARKMTLRTKSGLMVGLGETSDEVRQVMCDLRGVGCDILTIGQYLSPSRDHIPVASFIHPTQFDAWQAEALAMGFAAAAAGPFVRSSYHAESVLRDCRR
ncbi:MAG: lipoyl synthase [Planctomycetes bacterium]|nr:lipoyl synthase [Planctomycetota bacterium]